MLPKDDQIPLPLTSDPTDAEYSVRDGLLFRVCHGPSCGQDNQSIPIYEALRRALTPHGLGKTVGLAWQSCFGRCQQGPNVAVERWRDGALSQDAQLAVQLGGRHPDLVMESRVSPADVPALVAKHLGP